MKKGLIAIALLISAFATAQAFEGKGDQKIQIGANLQENINGISVSYDKGFGENLSIGILGVYALNLDNNLSADFNDRVDLKLRVNANLGSIINISDAFDVYPGLNLGLKNFGGHLGARYFFSDGLGIFTELATPFANYNEGDLSPTEKIHNQFNVSFGAVFNLR